MGLSSMFPASNCASTCIAMEGLVSKFTWKSSFEAYSKANT